MSLINDQHVYSYSQLTQFDECPYAFYLQRVEHLGQKSNGFAEQGTLIHDLIDQWAKGLLKKEDLVPEYERRYPEEVVTQFPRMLAAKGYAEKAYKAGLEYFENFDEFSDLEIIGTETKFETLLCGRRFVGIVDMVARDKATGELIVLDHKSKSQASFFKAEHEMWRQQLIYSQYVHEKYGQYPDLLSFNLFKENGMRVSKPFIKREFDEAQVWANSLMDRMESYEMLDWLNCKEMGDFFCQNHCSMREHCHNGKTNYKRKK